MDPVKKYNQTIFWNPKSVVLLSEEMHKQLERIFFGFCNRCETAGNFFHDKVWRIICSFPSCENLRFISPSLGSYYLGYYETVPVTRTRQ